MHRLFVYGSLIFPEVQRLLLGRDLSLEVAFLQGYSLYTDEEYLFLKENPEGEILGSVIELKAQELEMMDRWEQVPRYQRIRVQVEINSQLEGVWTYVGGEMQGRPASREEIQKGALWSKEKVIQDALSFLEDEKKWL